MSDDIMRFIGTKSSVGGIVTAEKLASYLQQENEVLIERVRLLEISLSSEREACAKVAEEYARQHDEVAAKLRRKPDAELNASKDAAQWIAHLIRERGNQ